MKYQFCPSCDKKLGVPEKRWAYPVTCPQCNNVFLPTSQYEVSSRPDKTPSAPPPIAHPPRPGKPSLRAMPLPAALKQNQPATDPAPANIPTAAAAVASAPTKPPINASLPTAAKLNPLDPPVAKAIPATEASAPAPAMIVPAAQTVSPESGTVSVPEKKAVARIIRTHDVEVPLSRDGKLPKLHLKDETKVESKSKEIQTSPIVLGALICFSLISSALILLLGDFQSNPDRQSAEKARRSIQNYYSVHEDRPMKPYQLELRAAQLAHSKGDRKAEIAAYRKVMARFRAEDRNQFVGLTGSPTADIELQELISILLRDAEGR